MRIGIGYDIHAFDPACVLVLGGVKIPGAWGRKGHSDADVLLHAITDALLGAGGLGDLGDHFPDTDPVWKDVPSALLLSEVLTKLDARGLAPAHADVTVVAERPKIAPHRAEIRDRLAALMGLETDRVNVKATTNEGLGAIGLPYYLNEFSAVTLRDVD